jgi:hypothetical protein
MIAVAVAVVVAVVVAHLSACIGEVRLTLAPSVLYELVTAERIEVSTTRGRTPRLSPSPLIVTIATRTT